MNLHPVIHFFAILGPFFFPGIPVAFAVWLLVDKLRHRRTDRAELARLLGGGS